MRRRWLSIVSIGLLLVCQQQLDRTDRPQASPQAGSPVEVHFSPSGGCTEAVVRELNAAKESVYAQAYSFTSAPIAKALVDAHRRGVKVAVILDKSQRTEKYLANWKAHAEHSEPYAGREKGYSETQQPSEEADPVTPTAAPVSDGYVASKNSEVFHRADCKSAAKISAKNVLRYATRDEAIQAGKKPCHECNP